LFTAFSWRSPSLEIVTYLVEKCPSSLTARNMKGKTPLHLACQSHSIEIIKYLIEEKGANIEEVDYEEKTCLLLACEKERFDIVNYLIKEKGANIEAKDSKGNNAQMVYLKSVGNSYYSSYHLDKDLIEYLLHQKNADVNARNNKGQTVLHIACKKGFAIIVEYLIENHDVNIHAITSAGESCLHSTSKVKELIEDHKDLSWESTFERDYSGFHEIAKVLIRKGINIFAKDFQGKLAFDYVDKDCQPIMFHLLSSTMARYIFKGYYCFCFERK